MCGRFRSKRADLLAAGMRAQLLPGFEEINEHGPLMPDYFPGKPCPIVRLDKDGGRLIELATWGLIPSWVTGKPRQRPINARGETVATSRVFKQAMQRRRCLVPAIGFYEPFGEKKPGKKRSQYFFRLREDHLFALAGLWERWKPDDQQEPIDTFTIITTEPNASVRPIHARMPVILPESSYDLWLDSNIGAEKVSHLVKPFEDEPLESIQVSPGDPEEEKEQGLFGPLES